MLPPWFSLARDELHVLIQPQRIELKRLKGLRGFKPQLVDQQTINLKTDETAIILPKDWLGVIEQLQSVFKDKKWHAASAVITLPSCFMRYAVVPWRGEITTKAEWQAYLNHHFVMAYGEVVKGWNMRMDAPKYKEATLASAMPSALHLALSNTFSQVNMRVTAISAYFMQAVNQMLVAHKSIRDGWFMVVEKQYLTMSLIEDGKWRMVRSLPLEHDISAQVEMLIQRETILKSLGIRKSVSRKNHPIFIHWPQSKDVKTLNIEKHQVVNMVSDRHFEGVETKTKKSMHWATR